MHSKVDGSIDFCNVQLEQVYRQKGEVPIVWIAQRDPDWVSQLEQHQGALKASKSTCAAG
jgi:hypothetical protein